MKKAAFPGRAWRLLRMALLWARRGGAFKRGIFVDLRLARGYLGGAGLRPGGGRCTDRLHLGEREFSIEDTPIFRFKTPPAWLLRIPCISPAAADFADDDGEDDFIFRKHERSSYLLDEEVEEEMGDATAVPDRQGFESIEEEDDDDEDDDDGIDMKAEEFIAKFYEQMKMQRQMSRNAALTRCSSEVLINN